MLRCAECHRSAAPDRNGHKAHQIAAGASTVQDSTESHLFRFKAGGQVVVSYVADSKATQSFDLKEGVVMAFLAKGRGTRKARWGCGSYP